MRTSETGRRYRRAMCERHYGAGADGLIVVLPSERADVRMRLFNADGSEAEVSGNGVRCLVKYAIEGGIAKPRDGRVTIEAVHGVLEAEASMDGETVTAVRLSMGPPRFAPNEVPVIAEMEPVIDFPLEVEGGRLRGDLPLDGEPACRPVRRRRQSSPTLSKRSARRSSITQRSPSA